MKKYLSSLLSLILIFTFLFSATSCKDEKKPEKKPDKKPAPVLYINPLTGMKTLPKAREGKRPIAVVVENSPAARPQFGLGSADITLEGLVEGGITRMLWFYSDPKDIPKIGPIRSARIDFVEMAEGLDAIFVHFGGAKSAYEAMRGRGTDDLDGTGLGKLKNSASYFKRDPDRRYLGIEHTAYSCGDWIGRALKETGVRTKTDEEYLKPFAFSEKPSRGYDCNEISFSFSRSYSHSFKYDAEKKLWFNYMNSVPMTDENEKQMAVTNVIILYFHGFSYIPETKGSIDMDLSEGSGLLASLGSVREISWSKGGPHDMLVLRDEEGNVLKLNKGKSYIGLVPVQKSSVTRLSCPSYEAQS